MARRRKADAEESPAEEMSRDDKIALITKRAEKEAKRLTNAGVPAFVNFGLAQAKPVVDEFGFTEENPLTPSAEDDESEEEEE